MINPNGEHVFIKHGDLFNICHIYSKSLLQGPIKEVPVRGNWKQ
jgi:hypothetical protein